jgi:Uma2 family endonuclease
VLYYLINLAINAGAMSAIPKTHISEEEYLQTERAAFEKSEYYNGEVFAMAGATKEHNAITMAMGAAIFNFLKGKGCRI